MCVWDRIYFKSKPCRFKVHDKNIRHCEKDERRRSNDDFLIGLLLLSIDLPLKLECSVSKGNLYKFPILRVDNN